MCFVVFGCAESRSRILGGEMFLQLLAGFSFCFQNVPRWCGRVCVVYFFRWIRKPGRNLVRHYLQPRRVAYIAHRFQAAFGFFFAAFACPRLGFVVSAFGYQGGQKFSACVGASKLGTQVPTQVINFSFARYYGARE